MSDYVGRHRPPTRAERRALEPRRRLPKALTAGHALPTAAAATLVLTAGGATAAQSNALSQGSPAAAPQAAVSPALADPALDAKAQEQVATTVAGYSDLAQRRQQGNHEVALDQGRVQERERVARDKERKAKKAAAEKTRQAKAEAAPSSAPASGGGSASTTQAAAPSTSGWVMPLANPVYTSGYGSRWGRLHAGNDFAAAVGTPLRAMSNGTVVYAGQMSGYGTMVDIRYADGTVSRYGHMSSISVSVGQSVAAGQQVGLSGNTGRSTGPHLHLEIHPGGGGAVDPKSWLAAKGLVY